LCTGRVQTRLRDGRVGSRCPVTPSTTGQPAKARVSGKRSILDTPTRNPVRSRHAVPRVSINLSRRRSVKNLACALSRTVQGRARATARRARQPPAHVRSGRVRGRAGPRIFRNRLTGPVESHARGAAGRNRTDDLLITRRKVTVTSAVFRRDSLQGTYLRCANFSSVSGSSLHEWLHERRYNSPVHWPTPTHCQGRSAPPPASTLTTTASGRTRDRRRPRRAPPAQQSQ